MICSAWLTWKSSRWEQGEACKIRNPTNHIVHNVIVSRNGHTRHSMNLDPVMYSNWCCRPMPYEFCNKIIVGLGRVIGSCAKPTARALSLNTIALGFCYRAIMCSHHPPLIHIIFKFATFLHMYLAQWASTHIVKRLSLRELSLCCAPIFCLSLFSPPPYLGSPISLFIILFLSLIYCFFIHT